MDQKEALEFIAELAKRCEQFRPYEKRAARLVTHPNHVRQSSFGVCGLSAIVRTMLRQTDLAKFAELLSAIFENGSFNDIQVEAGKLLGGRLHQWERKVAHEKLFGLKGPSSRYALDFILARSLGKLLKQTAPHMYQMSLLTSTSLSYNFNARHDTGPRTLFTLDRRFISVLDEEDLTDSLGWELQLGGIDAFPACGFFIDPVGAVLKQVKPGTEWWITLRDKERRLVVHDTGAHLEVTYDAYNEAEDQTPKKSAILEEVLYKKDGDMALDPDSMQAVMVKVIRASECRYTAIPLIGVSAAINTINNQFTDGKPFVYGFVNGGKGWLAASDRGADTATPFDGPAAPPRKLLGRMAPTAHHIVALTGPITQDPSDSTRYAVPVWSWGDSFTARIPKANLQGYLAGCLHGRL